MKFWPAAGATTLHFARKLALARDHLTVITHAFSIAAALVVNASHKVLMLPGQYDGREGLIHGPDTIDALQKFHPNKAFLGASGRTAEGPSDAGLGPGFVYGAMLRRSSKSFILADHAKFENPSLTVYGTWGPASTLITDEPPFGPLACALAEAGATVALPPAAHDLARLFSRGSPSRDRLASDSGPAPVASLPSPIRWIRGAVRED